MSGDGLSIWQVGAAPSPNRVDGLSMVVWSLGLEQARLGHRVTMVLGEPPEADAVELARRAGLELSVIPRSAWAHSLRATEALLSRRRPDIAHLHRAFDPPIAALAYHLGLRRVPYVISPHGIITISQVPLREGPKGHLYAQAVEKPRLRMAAGVSVLSRGEGRELARLVGRRYRGILRQMPNPVDLSALEGVTWSGDAGRPLLYLGRLAVEHKGLDILYEVARRVPERAFELYGALDPDTAAWFRDLDARRPDNLRLHEPIYGAAKASMLAAASMYIQTSRWDVLSISVIEAMYIGVPCAITEPTGLAEVFTRHNLGLVLPLDPVQAAARLHEAMAQPELLREWSERGRAYARKRFTPRDVAARYIQLYRDALAKRKARPPTR